MDSRLRLLFVLHCHQPPGCPSSVVEAACDRAYGPLLDALERHPALKCTLHLSGPLIDHLERHRPCLLEQVAGLRQRQQLELLSSGMGEPVLPLLPEDDRYGQLETMNDILEQRFGLRPTGVWLAERYWEPSLTSLLTDCGMDYTLLDDALFLGAGLTEKDLRHPWLTEDQAQPLKLIPIPARFRYAIPFRPVGDVLDELDDLARTGGGLVCLADDGEKFGHWPGTHTRVHQEGWLDDFFRRITESELLQPLTCAEALAELPVRGKVYPVSGAYPELQDWSLPPERRRELERLRHGLLERGELERAGPYLRAGGFRQFLIRYPEADELHQRSVRASALVAGMRRSRRADEARDLLYRAQCHDPLWHGLYGGVYLPEIRLAALSSLIRAEQLAETEKPPYVFAHEEDFDCDGLPELRLENDLLAAWFRPGRGGAAFAFDDRRRGLPLSSVMTRRSEIYHEAARERCGEAAVDWYRRGIFVDHFLSGDVTAQDLAECRFAEQSDFTIEPFRFGVQRTRKRVEASFEREGHIWDRGHFLPHILQKRFLLEAGRSVLETRICLRNLSASPLDYHYACECNFSFPQPGETTQHFWTDRDRTPRPVRTALEERGIKTLFLHDRPSGRLLVLQSEEACRLVLAPLDAVVHSERGPERLLQGYVAFFIFHFHLQAAGIRQLQLQLGLDEEHG